ncbi:MAG: hypothetical protein IJU76_00330 [Desulfovibrionaceae bacterium]|nr:hypothetical protein [Desulfovibrionaceae bacterium]
MRPPFEFFYISFEYMLYKYGFSNDAITALTVATSGEPEICRTAEGLIHLRHRDDRKSIAALERELLYDKNRHMYVATPRITIEDCCFAEIDFNPVDQEHLEFVESSIDELYAIPPLKEYEIYMNK